MMRRVLAAAALPVFAGLTLFAALPAAAGEADVLRLACKADNPALLAAPLTFSIDLAANQATETGSGEQFGVTAYRDGLGLWEAASGPSAIVYRIDRVKGRFARVDKQIRLDGACEKVDAKF